MKWSFLLPLTASAMIAGCQKDTGLKGTPATTLGAKANAACAGASEVEGAFTAPKASTTFNLSPVMLSAANLVLPNDQMVQLNVTCLANILDGIDRMQEPTVRLGVKGQLLGRQSTSDAFPGKETSSLSLKENSGQPEPTANFVCKTSAPRQDPTAAETAATAQSRRNSPLAGAPGAPMGSPVQPAPVAPPPAPTPCTSPAPAAAAAAIPANVRAMSLRAGQSARLPAIISKNSGTVALTVECAESTKLDTADKILAPTDDTIAPDLILGSNTQALFITKAKTSEPAKFILVTCEDPKTPPTPLLSVKFGG